MNNASVPHVSAMTTLVALDAAASSANLAVRHVCSCSFVFQDSEKFVEVVGIHVSMLNKCNVDRLTNFPNTYPEKQYRSNQKGFVEGLQIHLRDQVPKVIQGFSIERAGAFPKLVNPLPAIKFLGNGGQDGFCEQCDIGRNICSPPTPFSRFSRLNVQCQARACENSQRCGDSLYPACDVTTTGRSELCVIDSEGDSSNYGECGQCRGEDKPQKNADWLGVLHGLSLKSKPVSYSDDDRAGRS